MASWKIRRRLLIILSSFTGITLIQCRSLLQFSGTEKTNDEGGENNSEQFMSDLKGFVPLDDLTISATTPKSRVLLMLGLNSVDKCGSFVYLNVREL